MNMNMSKEANRGKIKGPSWTYGTVLLLLVMGFGTRMVTLEAQGLWRDEVDQLNFAMAPLSVVIANFTRAGWNGPLYPLLLRGWVALTGSSVFTLRYLSTLWGILSLAIFYKLGARLLRQNMKQNAPLWALALATFSPYLIWYAQEVKMYTFVPLLVLLALYALDRACTRPRWYWWVTVLISISLGVYSHLLVALLIPVALLWFIVRPQKSKRAWMGAVIVLALLVLPYLPLLSWIVPELRRVLVLGDMNTGYPTYTLKEMLIILLNAWSSGISGWYHTLTAVLFGILFSVGLITLILQRKISLLLSLSAWLALPLLAIWLISLRRPMFTDRYLIWCAPAFYLALGNGIASLGGIRFPGIKKQRTLSIVLLACMIGLDIGNIHQQATVPVKPEFHKAAAYLRDNREPDELLLFQIPYNHIVFDYYYSPALAPWAEAPFTNWHRPDGSYLKGVDYVDAEMQRLIQDKTGVWLVYSEVSLWDDRELVKQWLDTHGQCLDKVHFHLVSLYHYTLSPPGSSCVGRGLLTDVLTYSFPEGLFGPLSQERPRFNALCSPSRRRSSASF